MTAHPAPPMVLRTAAPGGLLRVNRAFQELFGLSAADLETTPLPDWIHPDDRPAFQAALDARTGCVVARHRRADGEWVELAWQLREGGQGCVALGRPEAAPQSTAPHMQRSALTVSASRTDTLHAMAKIVEAKNPGMRCSILLVDAAGECVTVGAGPSLPAEYNAAVEGLHIGPGVGSCGTAAFWNVPIVVEDIDVDPLWSGLRSAAKIAGVRACWSHPVTATHGGVLGAMALYNDTPRSPTLSELDGLEIAARMVGLAIERDHLETRLRESAKMEAIGRLAGGVAHDFNNLLTVILGHVELMRENPHQAPDAKTLDAMRHAANHASDITSQLLAFGRKQLHRPEPVRLGEALLDVMRVLDPFIGESIAVSVANDPSVDTITVDRTQLGQIFLNLVINAGDAMPHGGRLSVETRHATSREVTAADADHHEGSYVAISISDTGTGMDEQTMAKAFEPFFTTKESGGSGLGLATVYGLTRQNDGYITVESEVGRGTNFTLIFPKDAVSSPEDNATETTEPVARVLVAEDSDDIRMLVASVLNSGGFEIVQARDGAEALALVEDGLQIDLLIADVMMPRLGGVEFAARARQHLPALRVLFVSGHPFERLKLPLLDPTRELYLAKPFTPAQLRHEVYRALSLASGTDASRTA